MESHGQLPCLTLQGDPCFISCHSRQPATLTYVGKLALCTQGHGEGRGGRQLCLVVRFGQPADGVGVPSLLGLLLGLELIPVGGSRTQPGPLQRDTRGLVGVGIPVRLGQDKAGQGKGGAGAASSAVS